MVRGIKVRDHRSIKYTKTVVADISVDGTTRFGWVAQLKPGQARSKDTGAGAEPGVDEPVCSEALD
jgi:hypothetical protein